MPPLGGITWGQSKQHPEFSNREALGAVTVYSVLANARLQRITGKGVTRVNGGAIAKISRLTGNHLG
jgi:hypothetical protein